MSILLMYNIKQTLLTEANKTLTLNIYLKKR